LVVTRTKKPRWPPINGLRPGQTRPERGSTRLARAIVVLLAATLIANLVVGVLLLRNAFWGDSSPGPKTAAIVDQLGLTQPNPSFAQVAGNILEQAGYMADYYPGEDVTVDFYRDLPSHDYDMLILRVHSAIATGIDADTGEEIETEYLGLFSGEPFDAEKYPQGRLKGLGKASYYEGAPPLFGIASDFIRYSMRGEFHGATVLMMGCDGLTMDATAKAFVDKGAKAVVGWSGPVSASHTDTAAESLLRHLLLERLPIGDAVGQTMAEVGPDPTYGSRLVVYPSGG
jgi:hypothetical protein